MNNNQDTCHHLKNMRIILPSVHYCWKCLEVGDTWVHLRVCQICGEVSCCNSSKNKHATQHFLETGHPLIISAEPSEYWAYCYIDESFMEYHPEYIHYTSI